MYKFTNVLGDALSLFFLSAFTGISCGIGC